MDRASLIALIVAALGWRTSKGKPPWATTCLRNKRIAILSSNPEFDRIFTASSFSSGSNRKRTSAVFVPVFIVFMAALHGLSPGCRTAYAAPAPLCRVYLQCSYNVTTITIGMLHDAVKLGSTSVARHLPKVQFSCYSAMVQ